tara:strand:+ start:26156 stop:26614 length:459 start_codon:yes stop_codon:yes gene_type:complete
MSILVTWSQVKAQELIGTTGDYSPTLLGNLSWSLGEIITETYPSLNGQFTTGYQQVYDSTLSIVSPDATEALIIYPNPFESKITIKADHLYGNCSMTILDCQSKTVLKKTINFDSSKKETLDLSKLLKGYYFIKIHFPNSNRTIIQPIIKLL